MARRRLILVLAVSAAAASVLAASPSPTGPPSSIDLPSGEGEAAAAVPRTVDDDDILRSALPSYLRPIVVRGAAVDPGTVYDVTVVFRATRRVGPPRLQYAVVPAAADDDDEPVSLAFELIPLGFALLFCLILMVASVLFPVERSGDVMLPTKSVTASGGD